MQSIGAFMNFSFTLDARLHGHEQCLLVCVPPPPPETGYVTPSR